MKAIDPSKLNVLLVDDQPQVLSGLRRNLSIEEEDWLVHAAASGPLALEAMALNEYDIVVSDLRMPGMSGAEFLQIARDRYPNALRFILSGYADQDLMLKASGVAHRYLTKPCETAELVAAIKQVLMTQRLIHDDNVLAICHKINELHVENGPISRLLALTDDPECDTGEVIGLIERNPSLHATVLRISNGAFFGRGGTIDTLQDSMQILGLDLLRNIALIEMAKTHLKLSEYGRRCADRIMEHCVETSLRIPRLGKLVGRDLSLQRRLASAAILHDLGKLVLLAYDEKRFVSTCSRSLAERRPSHELEAEIFGCDHAALGGYIFELWGLPESLIRAIAWHHRPECHLGALSKNEAALLQIANYLAHAHEKSHYSHVSPIHPTIVKELGIPSLQPTHQQPSPTLS